jgi:hypothetical protein
LLRDLLGLPSACSQGVFGRISIPQNSACDRHELWSQKDLCIVAV